MIVTEDGFGCPSLQGVGGIAVRRLGHGARGMGKKTNAQCPIHFGPRNQECETPGDELKKIDCFLPLLVVYKSAF
ncbi:hypothetical protein [Tolypothrix sp. VBCCA 56010]|uniref:hypothetical protein n=1 Tax=Tolypothrix sp. VBCCA 56010 TaxID=3137731 RepID=UPI003D7F018E